MFKVKKGDMVLGLGTIGLYFFLQKDNKKPPSNRTRTGGRQGDDTPVPIDTVITYDTPSGMLPESELPKYGYFWWSGSDDGAGYYHPSQFRNRDQLPKEKFQSFLLALQTYERIGVWEGGGKLPQFLLKSLYNGGGAIKKA